MCYYQHKLLLLFCDSQRRLLNGWRLCYDRFVFICIYTSSRGVVDGNFHVKSIWHYIINYLSSLLFNIYIKVRRMNFHSSSREQMRRWAQNTQRALVEIHCKLVLSISILSNRIYVIACLFVHFHFHFWLDN